MNTDEDKLREILMLCVEKLDRNMSVAFVLEDLRGMLVELEDSW